MIFLLCVKLERSGIIILFSLFLGLFQPIMAWNEATMVFLNFWNFYSMFLEFSITCRVGTKRNDNFCFPSFSAFFNVFWHEMKPKWYSSNCMNFFAICLEFSTRHWVGTKRHDNSYFLPFSAVSNHFLLKKKP